MPKVSKFFLIWIKIFLLCFLSQMVLNRRLYVNKQLLLENKGLTLMWDNFTLTFWEFYFS